MNGLTPCSGKENFISCLRKTQLFSIAALLFVIPFDRFSTIKELFFFLLLTSFAAAKFLDPKAKMRESMPDKTLLLCMTGSFFWALIGVMTALDPSYSLNEILTKMSKQFLLFFLCTVIAHDVPAGRLKWVFLAFLASAILMSAYACYQFYQFPVLFVNRVQGFTGAFYRMATLLVLSIPFAVIAFMFRGFLKRSVIICLFLPVAFTALFFTFTRGAWIAVIAEVCLLTIIFLPAKGRILFASMLTVLLLITSLSYKSFIPEQLLHRGSERPRIEAISLSSDIIREYPITGIGYGKETFSKYYPGIYVQHAHNIFLNTAVETGLTGLFFLLLIQGILLKKFTLAVFHEKDIEKKILLSAVFASLIGFLSLNMFDYMYHGWPGQIFWMLAGIGYAFIPKNCDSPSCRNQ